MDEVKTVGISDIDLYNEQIKDVAEMRTSLLTFNKKDPNAARKAIQNVTILRVYHQLNRIVRYTDMMDKLEDKLYQCMDTFIDQADEADSSALFALVGLQERLQRSMIESHKLLEPYLSLEQLSALDIPKDDPADSFTTMILEQESREKIRTGVQELMSIIDTLDTSAREVTEEQTESVKNKAKEALEKVKEQQEATDTEETTPEGE